MSQPPQAQEEEQDEISPLEYARQNGLSQDYLARNIGYEHLQQIQKKKLDLPLLRSDVDSDCRKFASREGFDIKPRDIRLPLEPVAEGEGFDWIKQYENVGTEIMQNLRAEKIGVTRDAMAFLQSCGNMAWTDEDEIQLWAREQTFKRDLEAIENEIFAQDVPTPLRSLPDDFTFDGMSEKMPTELGDLLSSLIAPEQTLSSEPRPSKWEDFKVEVPLMPPQPTATSKTVRFSDEVQKQYYELASSPRGFDDSEIFHETFGDAYKNANQKAEQEKLSIEDTTARVDVPELNFDKPEAPWKRFEGVRSQVALSTIQKSFVVETIASSIPSWPGSGQLRIKLPWAPFNSSFAKLALEEDVQGNETTWQPFVEDNVDIIDSSSLIWKRAGLRILSDEEDGEEIDLGQFRKDSPADLSSIVKKRKMQFQEMEKLMHISPDETAVSATATSLMKKTTKSVLTAGDTAGGDFGLLGGDFSAQASINNYFMLRGLKRPKLSENSYLKPAEKHPARVEPENNVPKLPSLSTRKSPTNAGKLPVPGIQPLNTPTWIIVSTTLLKNRALIKRIEAQLPSVKLIERDFMAHNTSVWMPGSVTRSPVKSSLDSEADLILSPSVGIIVTTLQKIKQKPLPGDKTKPAIRERLEKVCLRYEKLLVLISEGNADEVATGLVENDCLAIAEFAGYLMGLEASITIQFVAGGEETLSKWIVSSIIQYRVDTDLLTDETFWELFLRRAGLNAFAAQAVVAALKAPNGVDEGSPSKAGLFGLAAFVEMGVENRLARFGYICGHRVLARVSAVIDARWE
ncbi:hypothetical protein BKA65DRAFT_394896 [Rhexocercosporidium sp. MPI-PUGE-AT-0058]|nr:hypothetical protein BKA65DRAFT_394896 [Rhexocercosporidium sp. MPI-PUGE-AT-0058]